MLTTKASGLDALDADPPSKKVVGPSGKEYFGSVLCCLRVYTQPRKLFIRTIEAKWFDPLILCTILCNCATMAWQSPLDPCCTNKAAFIGVMEWIYLYIFTFELVSKIFAYGFLFQEGTYLRDAWCQLDFIVVSLAWLPILFPETFGNTSAIRSVRALRPLRALKRVPGMPQMISAIMAAFPKLSNVVALCSFIFLVFGIVGMELFKGALHYRCASEGFVETPGHPVSDARRRLEALPMPWGLLVEDDTPVRNVSGSLFTASSDALVDVHAARAVSSFASTAVAAATSAAAAAPLWDLHALFEEADAPGFAKKLAIHIHRRSLKGNGGGAGGSSEADDGDDSEAAVGTPEYQALYDTGQACNPTKNAEAQRRRMKGGGASGGDGSETNDDPTLCPADTTCSYFDENLNTGLLGFDDIGKCFLIILQGTTFDTWTDPMYALMASFNPLVFIYFLLIAMLCGIFVVQLFLAVIVDEFVKAQEQDAIDKALKAAKLAKFAAFAMGGGAPVTAPPGPTEEEALLKEGTEKSDFTVVGEEVAQERGCCDCAPAPGTARSRFGQFMTGELVGNLSTGLVVYNLYLMCAPYYGMSEEYAMDLENKATMVSWAFIIEMFGKLLGIGCANYWADGWNQLDGTIVSLSIFEMVITLIAGPGANFSFLRILRMLRILRILRLMKSWKGLYKIIVTLGKTLPQLGNIGVLMGLVLLIFGLLGMTLFAGIYAPSTGYSNQVCPGGSCPDDLEERPRYHWDYFVPAMLTCFIMMTGGWVDIVQPAYAIVGGPAIIYCVIVVIVGCFVIVNLFVAVLLNAFASPDEEEGDAQAAPAEADPLPQLAKGDEKNDDAAEKGATPAVGAVLLTLKTSLEAEGRAADYTDDTREELCARFGAAVGVPAQSVGLIVSDKMPSRPTVTLDFFIWGDDKMVSSLMSSTEWSTSITSADAPILSELLSLNVVSNATVTPPPPPPLPRPKWPRDYSMLVFGPRNCFRLGCQALVADPIFDQVIVLAIIASSICLALDVPRLDPDSTLATTLHYLDYFWTALFFCEMMSKVVSFGFACGEGTYVTSAWNLLDLVIVTVSFLVLLSEFFPMFAKLKMLRILRVLRPLRLLARSPGMKLVIVSLFQSMPAVGNVVGVVLAFQLVFAILGMQIFMGALGTCSDPSIMTAEECHEPPADNLLELEAPLEAPGGLDLESIERRLGESSSMPNMAGMVATAAASAGGLLMNGWPHDDTRWTSHRRRLKGGGAAGGGHVYVHWANPVIGSFDSFGSAMMLLFVMMTGDGWDVIMFGLMDATEPGRAPIRNDSGAAAIFAVLWMFIGNFFAINLFVGVVVEQFTAIKNEAIAESGGSATMTPEQAQWVETMKMKAMAQPEKVTKPPANCFRAIFFHIVTSKAFDTFIIGVIVANVFVMACDYWGIENDEVNFTRYNKAMMCFSYIYYIEFTLKIIGLGPYTYFGDNWCRFDFTLVCTSLLDQFASELLEQFLPIPPMVLRVLRVLRILRILRLLKGPGARRIRDLIMTLVISFPPLMNVGGVLTLVVFMYGVLGVNLFTFVVAQENMTDKRNFKTLGSSMLLLLQCLTGDNWSGMMVDALVTEDSGKCSAAEGNCGGPIAIPYFVSFMVLGSMVVLNLVVAVILENFSTLGQVRSDLVSKDDMETFKEVWGEFDPDADNRIPSTKLPDLILALPTPLGIKGIVSHRPKRQLAIKVVLGLDVRAPNGVLTKLQQDENGEVSFQDVLDALVQRSFKHEDLADAAGALDADGDGIPDAFEGAGGGANSAALPFAMEMIRQHVDRWRTRFYKMHGRRATKPGNAKAYVAQAKASMGVKMAGGLPVAAPTGATNRAGSQSMRPADPAEQPKLSGYFATPATDRPRPTVKPAEPGRLSHASQKGQRQMSQRNGQPSQLQMPVTSGRPVSVSLDAVFEELTVTVPGSPTELPAHSQSISNPAKARPLSPQAVTSSRARTEIKEIVVGADALLRRSQPACSQRGAARRELPRATTDVSALTAARDKQNASGLGRAPSALASERAKSVTLGRQPAYTPPYEQMQQQSRPPPRLPPMLPPRPPAAAEPSMPVPARLPRPVTKEAPGLSLDA